jgi:hypothetical protein
VPLSAIDVLLGFMIICRRFGAVMAGTGVIANAVVIANNNSY